MAAAQKKLLSFSVSQGTYCYLKEHANKRICRYINSFICGHSFKDFDA